MWVLRRIKVWRVFVRRNTRENKNDNVGMSLGCNRIAKLVTRSEKHMGIREEIERNVLKVG